MAQSFTSDHVTNTPVIRALTLREVSERLARSPDWLRKRWRELPGFPAPVFGAGAGVRLAWSSYALDAWLMGASAPSQTASQAPTALVPPDPPVAAPPAVRSVGNGLVWRKGRPRWEPWPAARAVGAKGLNLRNAAGAWMTRGAAIEAADARADWSRLIIGAARGNASARLVLTERLAGLSAPAGEEACWRQSQLDDLIAVARTCAACEVDSSPKRAEPVPRSLDALAEGFAADASIEVALSTRRLYAGVARRLADHFGADAPVSSLTPGGLRAWYVMIKAERTPATARTYLGATAGLMKWARWQGWISQNPASGLGVASGPGRLSIWMVEQEQALIAFADACGAPDLADALTCLIWTGARPVDACKATMADLAGPVWRYVPQKLRRGGREAVAGIDARLRARIERRAAELAASQTSTSGRGKDPYFLSRPGDRGVHTPRTLRERFLTLVAAGLAAGAVPRDIKGLRLQDCRDTCYTRLWAADVPIRRMAAWTGAGVKDIEQVLRGHYVTVLDEGAIDTARQLADWLDAQGAAAADADRPGSD